MGKSQNTLKTVLIVITVVLSVILAGLAVVLFRAAVPTAATSSAASPVVVSSISDATSEETESAAENTAQEEPESTDSESPEKTVTEAATVSSEPAEAGDPPAEARSKPPASTRAPTGTPLSAAPKPGGLACDGRGVMIIESVIDDSSGTAQQRIDELLAQHPGSVVLEPGACASLRGVVDGQAVYPVVVDYGFDFDRLCQDYYVAGADPAYRNARILNNTAGAQSPC